MDISSAFVGITTPADQLYSQIGQQGWEATKVQFDKAQGVFVAEARNVHGEKLRKTGPNDRTALGNLLVAVMRHTHMRTAAQYKLGMWKTMFTDQLEPIAEAYAHAPAYNPKAAVAFKELGDASIRRAKVIGAQIQVEITNDPDPYANVQEMIEDVHKKKHLSVSKARIDHPVWSTQQALAFRVVHDVMGHVASGGDFSWQGQNLACAAHFPLLSPSEQQALFSECIAQSAYANHYRAFGPQKVATFPEFLEPVQRDENDIVHRGVHPSQINVPVPVPSVNPELSYMSKMAKKYSSLFTDPNRGWSSGVQPMQPETDGVGNAYLHHGDPLESQDVLDNARLIDTGWHSLKKGDGSLDRERAKLAICNAFRVVLLSPRKDLRWNAIHYQDISHIPADTDDPKVYWDALEGRRRSWNEAQGIDPEGHMIYFKFLKPFGSIIHQMNPKLSYPEAQALTKQTLFNWWTEEQQRIESEDEKKPADKQKSADEIERRANEALAKRIQAFIKDKTKPEEAAPQATPMSLFGSVRDLDAPGSQKPNREAALGDQYNLLTGAPALKYGAFMGTHLKAISKISEHADAILDAALEDVKDHDGSGHHFRATVLQLNVSGVGPKVCSFAWLLLQPMTSELATIDTHMMDVLGHNYEKEMNNRDYFKFERELAAGRDASGYQHVPLGTFQWGMWDHKRTGAGSHQDHSAMQVLDPKPHDQIDWASKANNLKGESWLNQAPDWWRNTQPARDAVAKDWDENVAKTTPQGQIPYQIEATARVASLMKEAGESEDEFHVGIGLPESIFKRVSEIASEFDFKAEDAEDLHMSVFYSPVGYSDRDLHEWIRTRSVSGLRFENARIDNLGGHDGRNAVVLRFDSPEATKLVNKLMDEGDDHGLEIKRFPGGWKAHITIGWTKEPVETKKYPDVQFRAGDLYVSIPRPLRKTADFSKGFAYWWNKEKPHHEWNAAKMAEYARGTKTSRKEAKEFLEDHKNDIRGSYDDFKRKFFSKFDRLKQSGLEDAYPWIRHPDGESDVGAPGETAMQFARLHYPDLSTPEIWKLLGEEGAGRDGHSQSRAAH